MAAKEQVISQAFIRSGGRCECNLRCCGHNGRCSKVLHWEQQGATWEVQTLNDDDPDDPLSYLLLCSACSAAWHR